MSAFVEHEFKRGYVLDESRLRKLHEIIQVRLSQMPTPATLSFKVFRGDSYSYETQQVADVISEDNSDWRAITRLALKAEVPKEFSFLLVFGDGPPSLQMEGDDRDSVFLLFSDVREYVLNEILVRIYVDNRTVRLSGLLLIIVVLFAMLFAVISSWAPIARDPAEVLASTDIQEKLNYLIGSLGCVSPKAPFFGLIGMLIVLFATMSGATVKLWTLVFPSNLFLFGKRSVQFEKRRRLLGKIFWTVIVGSIVGVLTPFLSRWLAGGS